MTRIVYFFQILAISWAYPLYNPFEYAYPLAYAYPRYPVPNDGYNYAPESPVYSSYVPNYVGEIIQNYATRGYSAFPEVKATLNILAEVPYALSNQFSVVPMFLVPKTAMTMVSQGNEIPVSDQNRVNTIQRNTNTTIQCTPAVRMVLEKPIIVGSLKSNILFPSEVQIIHEGSKIPIKIGAVIVPVLPDTYVSQETPIAVKVVYAVPNKPVKITITIHQDNDESLPGLQNEQSNANPPEVPFQSNQDKNRPQMIFNVNKEQEFDTNVPSVTQQTLGSSTDDRFGALTSNSDYVNNADAVLSLNQESLIVESEPELPPKNITVMNFPEQEAEPHIQVEEEDEELVNRNPPLVLAPAGIVQSTQPESHVEVFHNEKESPYLVILREQSKRKRV